MQDRRQHLERFRDQEVYSKLQESASKEQDTKVVLTKRELRMNEINKAVKDIQDMIGSDAHVILEGGEEIVFHNLIPDDESMLPT